jgi:hypothetical protein
MSHTDLTPYYAAKVATEVLRKAGKIADNEVVAPQKMYGLARPSKSTNVSAIATVPGSDPILFVGDEFARWLQAQLAGQGRTRTGVDMASLISEFEDGLAAGVDEDESDEVSDDDPDLTSDLEELLSQSIEAVGGQVPSFEEVAAQADTSAMEPEGDEDPENEDESSEDESADEESEGAEAEQA